jgi:hypothetical protein
MGWLENGGLRAVNKKRICLSELGFGTLGQRD